MFILLMFSAINKEITVVENYIICEFQIVYGLADNGVVRFLAHSDLMNINFKPVFNMIRISRKHCQYLQLQLFR